MMDTRTKHKCSDVQTVSSDDNQQHTNAAPHSTARTSQAVTVANNTTVITTITSADGSTVPIERAAAKLSHAQTKLA